MNMGNVLTVSLTLLFASAVNQQDVYKRGQRRFRGGQAKKPDFERLCGERNGSMKADALIQFYHRLWNLCGRAGDRWSRSSGLI